MELFINRNGHNGTCACKECETITKEIFRAFQVLTSSPYKTLPCPHCKRPIYSLRRGPWFIWTCWCHNHQPAVVEAVFDHPNKSFGFAKAPNKNVYFHFNRYHQIFYDGADWLEIRQPESFVVPKISDSIIYQEFEGPKGPKALWWSFYDEFVSAQKKLETRPLYRLVKRSGRKAYSRLHEKPVLTKLWEGTNLLELRRSYPERTYPTFEEEYMAYYFEVQNGDSQSGNSHWQPVADPR